MKYLPNTLSIVRIFLAFGLLFINSKSLGFIVVYLLCGLSDVADGYIARKFGFESFLGAKIDFLADFILVGVILFIFIPIINPPIGIISWMIVIALIKFLAVSINYIKYGRLVIIHTYGNKIMGVYIFILPILILFSQNLLFLGIGCGLGTLVAVEELLIGIVSKKLELNKKSIFST